MNTMNTIIKTYMIWEVLNEINAPLGKYAAFGNHDYGGGRKSLQANYENSGFLLL